MSARECCDVIGQKYNTVISARTVQHFVHHDMAGDSPKKRGPNGQIDQEDFKIILMAY